MQNVVNFFNTRPRGVAPALSMFTDPYQELRIIWRRDDSVEVLTVPKRNTRPDLPSDGGVIVSINLHLYWEPISEAIDADAD
jgi:hypothetical protein